MAGESRWHLHQDSPSGHGDGLAASLVIHMAVMASSFSSLPPHRLDCGRGGRVTMHYGSHGLSSFWLATTRRKDLPKLIVTSQRRKKRFAEHVFFLDLAGMITRVGLPGSSDVIPSSNKICYMRLIC